MGLVDPLANKLVKLLKTLKLLDLKALTPKGDICK